MGEVLAEEHAAVDLESVLAYVIQNAIVISAPPLQERVCVDPDDDKFLACALASGSTTSNRGDFAPNAPTGYFPPVPLYPSGMLRDPSGKGGESSEIWVFAARTPQKPKFRSLFPVI